jgi:WD40 repeat protein
MFKLLLASFFLSINTYAKDIKPSFILKTSGLVNDFVIDGSKLYVATTEGVVDIFDLQTQKLIEKIELPSDISTKQEKIPAKILSVDRLANKTLLVSASTKAYKDVWLHDGKKLKVKDKLAIKEARFIDEKNFLFGTLGYELMRYTNDENYAVYKTHVEESAFSDLVIDKNKTLMISASESGQVTISDLKSGKILKKPPPQNLDNIYKLAYKNGTIITAGQDRRVGVYPKTGKAYHIKSNFLVYAVGISPSGKTGIYSSGEDNILQLFNIKDGTKTDKLLGQNAIPNTIKFFDEIGVFSAGYDDTIYYWYLD